MSRPGEVVIDCGPVRSVEIAGAKHVLAVIERCIVSRQPAVIVQPEVLGEAALAAIEAGRRDDSPACWMLAMLATRLRSERQQFEDLAIDYCVTYEVSPPSWEPPPESIRTERRARPRSASEPAYDPRSSAFVLSGEVAGTMESELQALRNYASARGDVVIDCRNLRRIDFAASGAMLNAVVGLTGAGKKVLFVEPNHLVLALMMLMGIVDLVDIRRRRF
jgi:ABC-type transporter Mla MlaB component